MFYPEQTVDGVVSRIGGPALRKLCRELPVLPHIERVGGGGVPTTGGCGMVRCPVGQAVITRACGDGLLQYFHTIVHTVPPLFLPHRHPSSSSSSSSHNDNDNDNADLLHSCWINSLHLAIVTTGSSIVTAPLIGAGARGAPLDIAISTAAAAVSQFSATNNATCTNNHQQANHYHDNDDYDCDDNYDAGTIIELVVRNDHDAQQLIDAMENAIDGISIPKKHTND